MRRLIVNADDFGLTLGVNQAILEATRSGIVTSTTLMANGSAFVDAVRVAKEISTIGVGCHVILAGSQPGPLLSREEIVSLVNDSHSPGTSFHHSLLSFARRALMGKLDPQHIEAEATAQIRKLQSAGFVVTHFDTHKHTHLFPQVLRPILAAAKSCGLRKLRNPFPPRSPLFSAMLFSKPRLWKRHLQVKWLSQYSRQFHEAVREAGMVTTDGTLGIVVTGSLNINLFQAIIENLPDGTWEFVCHPGYNDHDLCNSGTRLLESRVKELEVLTSKAAREIIQRNQVELISFRDV